ncbi:BnaC09g12700D [Brassica napus]|uniref:BnaC09g12700D protein n=1 Tax=Brassica napus TaxID=3708 RepID=A0A078F4I3_BRANA|nr:BnaC09g12700D [Brassica napus]
MHKLFMVWSLAYATRLGKAVAGEAYMCVLWSYRRLHCWTDSLIEFDGFAQETQEFEGRLRGNNRALLSLA